MVGSKQRDCAHVRGKLLDVAKWTILACVIALGTATTSPAADDCTLRVTTEPGYWDDLSLHPWILSGKGPQCEPKGLLRAAPDCDLVVDPQHGAVVFGCENGLHGHWGARSPAFFDGPAIGDPRTKSLPTHQPVRETWLAPVHTEGVRDKDASGDTLNDYISNNIDNYVSDYPQQFTRVDPTVDLANAWFGVKRQTLYYTTVGGRKRAAVTGEAALACLKLYFVSWTDPNAAKETEERLSSFLQQLRIQSAQLTGKRRDEICW
jgi:hypothetical protein